MNEAVTAQLRIVPEYVADFVRLTCDDEVRIWLDGRPADVPRWAQMPDEDEILTVMARAFGRTSVFYCSTGPVDKQIRDALVALIDLVGVDYLAKIAEEFTDGQSIRNPEFYEIAVHQLARAYRAVA